MCWLDLNIDIIMGTTHIKTIFIFSPGTGKHFFGNVSCSSEGSVTKLICILHLVRTIYITYPPEDYLWCVGTLDPMHHKICKLLLFGSGTLNQTCVEQGRKISPLKPQNSLHCLMEDISSTEAKRDGTQLSHAACMRLKDDLNKAEKTEKVTTLNELENSLMSAFISKIYFVLL